MPGLLKSRTIGDSVAHTVGVVHVPDVVEHVVDDKDLFLLFGTAGLFQMVPPKVRRATGPERTRARSVASVSHPLRAIRRRRATLLWRCSQIRRTRSRWRPRRRRCWWRVIAAGAT